PFICLVVLTIIITLLVLTISLSKKDTDQFDIDRLKNTYLIKSFSDEVQSLSITSDSFRTGISLYDYAYMYKHLNLRALMVLMTVLAAIPSYTLFTEANGDLTPLYRNFVME